MNEADKKRFEDIKMSPNFPSYANFDWLIQLVEKQQEEIEELNYNAHAWQSDWEGTKGG